MGFDLWVSERERNDKVKCEDCYGTDHAPPCTKCPRGELYKENGFHPLVEDSSSSSVKCTKCRGTGEDVCKTCDGTKMMRRIKISNGGMTSNAQNAATPTNRRAKDTICTNGGSVRDVTPTPPCGKSVCTSTCPGPIKPTHLSR